MKRQPIHRDVDPRVVRIQELNRHAWESLRGGRETAAIQAAKELLALASDESISEILADRSNSIHCAYTVIGAVSCDRGDVETAVQCLRKSAMVSGSPQLSSFGPSMHLAMKLLDKGKCNDVLEFLRSCEGFWEVGVDILREWQREISRGKCPKFGAHLQYEP